jgi:hypothetical protein
MLCMVRGAAVLGWRRIAEGGIGVKSGLVTGKRRLPDGTKGHYDTKGGYTVSVMRAIAGRAGAWWKSIRAVSLRPHISTLVLLVPLLGLLVLMNWPAWRVKDIDLLRVKTRAGYSGNMYYSHGWPMAYLRRKTWQPSPSAGALIRFSPWRLQDGVLSFSLTAIACDVAAATGILVLAGSVFESRRRRRQTCFQAHLWELFALITIAAMALSYYAVQRKQFAEEEQVYHRLYHGSPAMDPFGNSVSPDELTGPEWLWSVIGDIQYCELFIRHIQIYAHGDDLRDVVKLRHLRALVVDEPNQDQIRALSQLPELEVATFNGPWHGENCFVEMPDLPRLRWLVLVGPAPREQIVSAPPGFWPAGPKPKVDRLTLPPAEVDNVTLQSVGRIKTLVYLRIDNANIDDAGLESLRGLRDLCGLCLVGTKVTEVGIRRMQAALPDCHIEWSPREP